jgi:hypothetical protein
MNRCTNHGRRFCVACFFQTALYPVEHALWGHWLGPLIGVVL